MPRTSQFEGLDVTPNAGHLPPLICIQWDSDLGRGRTSPLR